MRKCSNSLEESKRERGKEEGERGSAGGKRERGTLKQVGIMSSYQPGKK